MRLFEALAISALVTSSVSSAFAQTNEQQPRGSSPTLQDVQKQHPEWFQEQYQYKPCPADVGFANGKNGCLG
jgi:hypothetical protein